VRGRCPPEIAVSREERRQERRRSEAELIGAVAAGSSSAMTRIYEEYSSMLLGIATRILRNRSEAEEVLQEVFVQVWRQARRYDPERSSLSTWLVLLTRSRAIDRLRSRRVQQRTVAEVREEGVVRHESQNGPGNVLMRERRRRLTAEMGRLPTEQREVLELAFFSGLTQREIAARTDTPLGTVKTRALLAMRKLRAALREEIEDLL
jgi:RNA polymerase sigma-70 factor (ECF subfamily)